MNKNIKSKLANNLSYILAPINGVGSVTVLCLVGAGTRYETPENNGISHFLEHMVFKGTKKYPRAKDIALEVDRVGGEFNAFTGKEFTGFYVKTAEAFLETAMSVVASLVFEPLIPAKELEIERGVILEEMKMYEDLPQVKVNEVFESLVFRNSSLGWETIGKEKAIRSVLRNDFLEYMDLLYLPNRMVVVVAGGIKDDKKTVEMITEYFGIRKNEVRLSRGKFKFDQNKMRKKIIEKGTEQTHLVYGFRTFGRGNKESYKLSVLSAILGGGMSSRFFTEIREKRGLAYYVSTTNENYIEDGYLAIRAGTSKETVDQVIDLAKKEFEKIKTKKVGETELKKAKEYIKGHFVLSMEDSYQVASFYGEDWLMNDRTRSVSEVLKNIDKVTSKEVMELANQVFLENKSSLAVIR